MKRIILAFILTLSFLPAEAGIFDKIFGGSEKRGQFLIQLTDNLDNDKTISKKDRNVKIRLFYEKQFFNAINTSSFSQVRRAFRKATTVKTQFLKNGPKTDPEQDISFELLNLKADDPNEEFNEIVFKTSDFVLDRAQRLIFTFDIERFAEELNIPNVDLMIDKSEELVRYKAITIEPKNFNLDLDSASSADEEDAFSPQIITGTFSTKRVLDLSIQETDFDLQQDGKTLIPFAKRKGKKFKLSPSINGTSFLTNLGDGKYQVRAPIKIKAKKAKQLKQFRKSKKFKVGVPLLIETQTDNGLEVKIKLTAIQKLNSL